MCMRLAQIIAISLACVEMASAGENVVLVHGLNMDGSAWHKVHKRLTSKGYDVTVVQMPMTSIQEDVAAVNRVIDMQDGPVTLVGHSYGGMVISQAGMSPKVQALVYIAAFQPEVGESLGYLNTSMPAELPQEAIRVSKDGYYVVARDAWITYVANGLTKSEAVYTADFQSPANTSIFSYQAELAAWKHKPHWSLIANDDLTITPELQRMMSKRSKAKTSIVEGGHLLPISHSEEVAAVIESAASFVE
ncbi:alpha/beta hydrolase [Microbulbifer sp. A4B17]|nr:alpha/beta hydrolase [Microbulbifer sp. A4B17]